MAEPNASAAARALYDALDPAFTTGDEDRDWVALKFCMAATAGALSQIYEYVGDAADGTPGWQQLLDPELAPAEVLPWLAQFSGAVLTPDMSEAQQRDAIANPEAFGRGTVAAIEQVAARRLTGTKTVIVTERYTGSAWRLRVETLESETPEPDRTKQEIIDEQKPIGVLLFFNERAVWDWAELNEEAEWNTWAKVQEQAATWFDVRTHEP